MADIDKVLCVKNGGSADVTATAGAATQTVVLDRSFENIVVRVENTDAATAGVTLVTAGSMTADSDDVVVEVAQNEVKYLAGLESMFFRNSDGKLEIQVLDPDGSEYSGTVTNVTFEVIELPKGLID